MRKILLLPLMILSSVSPLWGQSLKGFVFNQQNKEPVSHASISVKNSLLGTSTNKDGLFSLDTKNDSLTLLVSCVGYETREMTFYMKNGTSRLEIPLQPASLELNKSIVVTASRNEKRSFQIPEAVSVLTRQELKNRAPRSMAEALIGETGVWMQKTNHGGGSPFIRGLTGNQTLLLIDGIRLNNAAFRYGPNQYFNTIDLFSVDRAEVIRGKGSVLYGSDALGGVINVITRTPEYSSGKARLGGRGKIRYMNKGMEKSGMGELAYQSENLVLLGNVNYKDFGDLFAGGSLGFERPSGYNETGINLKIKGRFNRKWQITGAFHYIRQNDVPRYDQVTLRGYQTYKFDPQIHGLTYFKTKYHGKHFLFKKITVTGSYQIADETRKIRKEDSPLLYNENDVVKTHGLSVESYAQFSRQWDGVTGIEFYSDQVNSGSTEIHTGTGVEAALRGLYPDNSGMKNLAVFSQHTLKWKKFHLNAGGRFNTFRIESEDETFGKISLKPHSLVGNLALQCFFSPRQQLILSAHSAFRAPNINDISSFGLFDYGIEIPSTDLSPEKTMTLEAGYKISADKFSLALNAFTTRLNDQIVRVEATYNGKETIDGERVYKKQNIARSNIHGVEFESGWRLNRHFSIINNLTWLYGKNLKNGEPMRRIPPFNGKLALKYSESKVSGGVEFLFAARQDRLSGGDIEDHRIPDGGTPGWNIVNFKLGYSWEHISLNAGLHNLFNQAYRMHGSGVDGYGRSFRTTLEFKI